MATTAISRADRWSNQNLDDFRARKRKKSDACIRGHVATLEKLAALNNGYVPTYTWLNEHGHFGSYQAMKDYPAAFAHLRLESEKKFEVYQAHKTAKPVILPPAKHRSLAEYNINGAHFNPTELNIDAGLSEGEWMEVGRTLATVCQSAFWWVGDWVQYGFSTYGKKVTYDLAQQATGYTRTALYSCARVAKRFPAHRRVEALTFFHHVVLAKFPPEMSDRLLAEAVETGLTARQIRALADEESGTEKQQKNRVVVHLQDDTYRRLLERANGRPLAFIVAQMIVDCLEKPKGILG